MGKKRALVALATAALVVISTGAIAAMRYPASIRSDAERIAAGRPYCLALPGAHRPVKHWLDLTPFFALGNRLRQHLVLYVEGSSGIEGYHWSYGSSQFNPDAIGMQHCLPRADFLDEMKDEGPGFCFVLNGSAYIIPPKFDASHIEEDFISLDFGLKEKRSGGNDNVEIGLPSVERWRRVSTDSVKMAPKESQSVRTEGAFGFNIQDFDSSGRLQQEFGCLHGKSLCVLKFVAPPGLFHVVIDETSEASVPEIRQRILAIWNGFSLEP